MLVTVSRVSFRKLIPVRSIPYVTALGSLCRALRLSLELGVDWRRRRDPERASIVEVAMIGART